MKPIIPIACLATGIAVGWLARPLAPSSSSNTANSSAPATTASTVTRQHPSTHTGEASATKAADRNSAKGPTPTDEDKARRDAKMKAEMKKAKEQMAKRMTDIQRKKFEARFTKMVAELNLSPEQQAKIRAQMEARFTRLGELFTSDEESNQAEQWKEAGELMKTDGLEEATTALLSDEQKQQLDAFKTRERQGRIESRALKDLGNVTNVLELSQEQRDQVYQVLTQEAAAREDKQKTAGMMTAFSEGMGFQFDDELGVQDLLQEQMESHMDKDKPQGPEAMADMQKTFRETIRKRTEQKVNALRPYLNETQIQQYRDHLDTKATGLFNMFGGADEGDTSHDTYQVVPGK